MQRCLVLSYFLGKLQIYHCVCRFYSMLKCFGWLRISSVFVLAFFWNRPSTLYVRSINHRDTFASTGFLQWTFSLFLSSGFTNVSTSLCHCVRSSVCPRLSSLLMFACLFPLRDMRHCTAEGKYGTEEHSPSVCRLYFIKSYQAAVSCVLPSPVPGLSLSLSM